MRRRAAERAAEALMALYSMRSERQFCKRQRLRPPTLGETERIRQSRKEEAARLPGDAFINGDRSRAAGGGLLVQGESP